DTENLYIEGDNLEVLKLLQTAYYRKVKMIYIDPPYNTGNDFVYEDDFKDPMARYKEVTQQTTKSNPETMGRFHTNWLNMMYPRLRLAANLLRDDGVIFISIDDHEIDNLKKLCNEVFGEENFVSQIVWQKKYAVSNDDPGIAAMHEYLVAYQKSGSFKRNLLPRTEKQLDRYKNLDNDPRGVWSSDNYISNKSRWERPTLWYSIIHPRTGAEVWPDENAVWRYSKENHIQMQADNRLYWGPNNSYERPRIKRFLNEIQDGVVPATWWPFTEVGHNDEAVKETNELLGKKVFSTPKPIRFLSRILQLATAKNGSDIVLDFFAGSAATAHAVMQLNAEDGGNRKFICVQLPEVTDENSEAYKAGYKNICEIGKERIRRAGQKLLTQGASKTTLDKISEEELPTLFTDDGMIESGSKSEYLIKTDTIMAPMLDIGFKVFKLDTSNLREWDSTPVPDNDLNLFYQRLNDMVDSIKPDRAAMDVVYEVMLKMGIPLEVPVTYMDVNGKVCYVVGDLLLLICFAENIVAEDIEAMAKHAPAKIICAEQSFADDSALSNAHYILRDKQIELKLI
ncbi:MAG: site-specific DNA-methyltransferase, partial [Christensenellaceae bacterium]